MTLALYAAGYVFVVWTLFIFLRTREAYRPGLWGKAIMWALPVYALVVLVISQGVSINTTP